VRFREFDIFLHGIFIGGEEDVQDPRPAGRDPVPLTGKFHLKGREDGVRIRFIGSLKCHDNP
jgi:hypothetical protein